MENRKWKKRIFGVSVFLVMVMLAVGTMVSFASGEKLDSYSMMITKKLDDGAPAAAQQQEYQFKIEGTVSDKDGSNAADIKDIEMTVKYADGSEKKLPAGQEKIVKIKGEGSVTLTFPPKMINITAVEEIDADDVIEDGGKKWSVTETSCETEMTVSGTETTVRISKPGGAITLTRPSVDANDNAIPADSLAYYTLTGEGFHGGKASGGTKLIPVAPGKTVTLGNDLDQGVYTIKEVKPIPGFSVLVGPREIDVDAGEAGKFYINSDKSTLTIKAPALAEGESPRTHYYRIESTDGWIKRDIEVRTDETAKVEHLPKGEYTICVYKTYEGLPGQYTVTVPETEATKRERKFSNINGKRYYYMLDGDYMDSLTFYPFKKNGKLLPSGTKYIITYEGTWVQEDGTTNQLKYNGGSRWARNEYTVNKKFVPGDNKKLIISVTPEINPDNFPGSVLPISWISYKQVITEYTTPQSEYDVDERGYVIISKLYLFD